MDKKTIILVVALGLLVIFWMPIMTTLGLMKAPAPQPQRTTADSSQVAQEANKISATQDSTAAPIAASKVAHSDTTSASQAENIVEDSIIVETEAWIVTLSNYGGGPVSHKLKNYKYLDGNLIEMLPSCQKATPELDFNALKVNAGKITYQASLAKGKYIVGSTPLELAYTYKGEGGGTLIKKYRFYNNKYQYDLIIEVIDRASLGIEREYSLEWNNPLEPTELRLYDDYNAMWAMGHMGGERIKFDDYTDNKYSISLSGSTNWIATRSKYFASILVPRSQLASGAKSSGVKEKLVTPHETVQKRNITIGLMMEIPSGDKLVDSFSVFVGPMDYDILKSFDNTVVDIFDIGTTPVVGWIIKIFAIPIMWILPRMYAVIPNYGFVIMIFALIIKLITLPLSKKTVKSMMAMKELQPKMEELKKKHKNNPQALNKEMMKLYKDMGINPFSGCLPYLPQLPLFFALFAVFSSTILLRQAPFLFWWNDLSRGALSLTDPYIILVALMMILMFVQQKMTMTDPKNKMLIYLMPVMMGFFFYKASAGLVLYWTSFSLFSFIEQLVFKPKKLAPFPEIKS